jgi:hypothetical protein
VKKQFIVMREGRPFALYAGLLDEAHQQGLTSIDTELVQAPTQANGDVAICRAKVTTSKGTFSGLGDAAPNNVPNALGSALIRMAETRAKARALRDAVNVGITALEELGDAEAHSAAITGSADESSTAEEAPPSHAAQLTEPGDCTDCGRKLTLGQTKLSMAAFGVPLCPKCQQARRKPSGGAA